MPSHDSLSALFRSSQRRQMPTAEKFVDTLFPSLPMPIETYDRRIRELLPFGLFRTRFVDVKVQRVVLLKDSNASQHESVVMECIDEERGLQAERTPGIRTDERTTKFLKFIPPTFSKASEKQESSKNALSDKTAEASNDSGLHAGELKGTSGAVPPPESPDPLAFAAGESPSFSDSSSPDYLSPSQPSSTDSFPYSGPMSSDSSRTNRHDKFLSLHRAKQFLFRLLSASLSSSSLLERSASDIGGSGSSEDLSDVSVSMLSGYAASAEYVDPSSSVWMEDISDAPKPLASDASDAPDRPPIPELPQPDPEGVTKAVSVSSAGSGSSSSGSKKSVKSIVRKAAKVFESGFMMTGMVSLSSVVETPASNRIVAYIPTKDNTTLKDCTVRVMTFEEGHYPPLWKVMIGCLTAHQFDERYKLLLHQCYRYAGTIFFLLECMTGEGHYDIADGPISPENDNFSLRPKKEKNSKSHRRARNWKWGLPVHNHRNSETAALMELFAKLVEEFENELMKAEETDRLLAEAQKQAGRDEILAETAQKLARIRREVEESQQAEAARRQAEEERQRAEEERSRAEEEYRRAAEERRRAEEKEQQLEEEHQHTEERERESEAERRKAQEQQWRAEEHRRVIEELHQRADTERRRALSLERELEELRRSVSPEPMLRPRRVHYTGRAYHGQP